MGSWGSADGTNREAMFYGVFGVSVDTGGNVFVADAGNAMIRKLRPVGTNWVTSTVAGLAAAAMAPTVMLDLVIPEPQLLTRTTTSLWPTSKATPFAKLL
jgi:hypothetical protein